MNRMRVLLLCLGCLLASVAGDYEELFQADTTKLLNDDGEWKVLFNCLMDRGPCEKYQIFKDTIPKLLANKCEGCTPEQKERINKTVQQLSEKYPKDFAEVSEKLLLSKKPESK